MNGLPSSVARRILRPKLTFSTCRPEDVPPSLTPPRLRASIAPLGEVKDAVTTSPRRFVFSMAVVLTASIALPRPASSPASAAAVSAATPGAPAGIRAEIAKRHDESVKRLQEWIRQPSIAAENRGMNEGCDLMMRLARDAGFEKVTRIDTDGQPGVFATLDAGAPRTIGLYFMYDVKQVDPAELPSPPWDAAIVDKPGFGKGVMGRGAVNQKGPEAAFLAALHAIRGAGKKPPVNLVLVAEGEEEIGSPHFRQVVQRPEVAAALKRCSGVFMPSAEQDPDGSVTVSLGAKGVVELELVASGEKWGRGPGKDVHSANRARLDSPAFHLVQALATLVNADGDPAIDGFADKARPAKRGFGDIEVNPSGGYDPTSASADAPLIRAQTAVYKRAGLAPILWPRNAGSYPGFVFTGEPLRLPAGHFGLGHGSGAHAPDEYYVIESTNPKVSGWDGAVASFVDYLYELAAIR